MRWLGPLLHLMFPPVQDPVARAMADAIEKRQGHLASLDESRRRIEALAADPLDDALHSIIKDL